MIGKNKLQSVAVCEFSSSLQIVTSVRLLNEGFKKIRRVKEDTKGPRLEISQTTPKYFISFNKQNGEGGVVMKPGVCMLPQL